MSVVIPHQAAVTRLSDPHGGGGVMKRLRHAPSAEYHRAVQVSLKPAAASAVIVGSFSTPDSDRTSLVYAA
jgi:hypothetical protein